MFFYTYSSTAIGEDDGYNFIRPNDLTPAQPGGWVLTRAGIATETTSTLAAIGPTQRQPNAPIYVQAAQKWFNFQLTPSAIPGAIVPAIGPGVWVPQAAASLIPPYKLQINLEIGQRFDTIIKSFIPQPPILGTLSQGQRSGVIFADATIPPILGTLTQGQRSGINLLVNVGNTTGTLTQGQHSGAAIVSTVVTINDDLLDMTTVTKSSVNSRLTTKPTNTPGTAESVGFIITETFQDLGYINNAIIDAVTAAPTECVIRREGYWRWVPDLFLGSSWEWISGRINLRIDKVSQQFLESEWSSNPANLLIRPDFEGQILFQWQTPYSGGATVEYAYRNWVAFQVTSGPPEMQVPGTTNRWWAWRSDFTGSLINF